MQMCLVQLTLLLTQSPPIITNHIFPSGTLHIWVLYFRQSLKVSHKAKKINPGPDMLSQFSKTHSAPSVFYLILMLL